LAEWSAIESGERGDPTTKKVVDDARQLFG